MEGKSNERGVIRMGSQFVAFDNAEFRAQLGRANISQTQLADLASVHRNTVGGIYKGRKRVDLETLEALTRGLNVALRNEEQPEIHPFDLLLVEGFPSPQVGAPVAA